MPNSDRSIRQVRSIPSTFRVREAQDDTEPIIEGYFAVYNSPYPLWEGACEIVAPGAFSSSLGTYDIRALIDHETRLVLGRTGSGTLTLREDEKGLWGEIRINPNDTDAMNLYSRVQRGDVNQCSFGFDILREDFIDNADGTCQWVLREVRLYEVSVVTFPAYEATSVSARQADYATIRARQLEAWKHTMKERINHNGT